MCMFVVQNVGLFWVEIVDVEVVLCCVIVMVSLDEQLCNVCFDKIFYFKLVFVKDGIVMVVNVLFIFDGVVVLIMICVLVVEWYGLILLVKVMGYVSYGMVLDKFFVVFIGVVEKLLVKIGIELLDYGLFEVNEVFVVVVMVVMKSFGLFYDVVNVNGGVCVLGYLIGVFGVWIMVILLYVMCVCNVQCGMVVICIGGGEVIVIGFEFMY